MKRLCLTSGDVLLQQLYLQVEDLLLQVAQGVFHPLSPRHHVAQVAHLKRMTALISL